MSSTEARLHRKGFNDITAEEVDELLAESHVCVVSFSRKTRSPFSVPVWFEHRDGKVFFGCDRPSLKAKLLNRTGHATVTVQRTEEPYRYVMLEGDARLLSDEELESRGESMVSQMTRIFARYLEPDLVERYAAVLPLLAPDYAIVEMTPTMIIGENLRRHADWLPLMEDIPKIKQALAEGRSAREALDSVAGAQRRA